jgi:hypothetical protein
MLTLGDVVMPERNFNLQSNIADKKQLLKLRKNRKREMEGYLFRFFSCLRLHGKSYRSNHRELL